MSAEPIHVAFVGNPNAGKTSLFNALTGSNQRVGNYPGVTVEKVSARIEHSGVRLECHDVPGLYSSNAVSEDELVAWNAIQGPPAPDVLVYVLDITNLERHLFFFTQLAETRPRLVVALTMTDALAKTGAKYNRDTLAQLLGVPVVPVIAHKGAGVKELLDAIVEVSQAETGDNGVPLNLSTAQRYEYSGEVRKEVIVPAPKPATSTTKKIDRILTHRVFGLIIFVGIMYLLFQSIYTLAGPVQGWIEDFFGWLGGKVGGWTEGNPMLQSLLVDGLIAGIGGALVFLPQIVILFALIAALEGSGYLARAAFLMDKLLGWCGLSGRAFVPLLSSFACAIPGVMAARVMPDPKSRLATILVAPLMSCSARLPVYILLIGAIIQPQFGSGWAGFTLFAMHLLGLLVAIPVVLVLNRGVLKGKRLPFVLELPRYQWPKLRDVWISMYSRAKVFVTTAGTVIVAMSILIWATTYFPRSEGRQAEWRAEYAQQAPAFREAVSEENFLAERTAENSYLGQFGRAIEPAFRPLGFDWRLSTAIVAAFPAREVVVSSMGIIFSQGAEQDEESADLRRTMQEARWPDGRKLFTPTTAVGFMVFFALCCQCMSTLAAVKRETNGWKWPAFMFFYMTALAYLGAWIVQLVG
ncbi:MAG: ferrous iron transport protein B [Chthonomonas sp.]|nr:ferrous iron transport protein B [Chthonomonas sp.]